MSPPLFGLIFDSLSSSFILSLILPEKSFPLCLETRKEDRMGGGGSLNFWNVFKALLDCYLSGSKFCITTDCSSEFWRCCFFAFSILLLRRWLTVLLGIKSFSLSQLAEPLLRNPRPTCAWSFMQALYLCVCLFFLSGSFQYLLFVHGILKFHNSLPWFGSFCCLLCYICDWFQQVNLWFQFWEFYCCIISMNIALCGFFLTCVSFCNSCNLNTSYPWWE